MALAVQQTDVRHLLWPEFDRYVAEVRVNRLVQGMDGIGRVQNSIIIE